MSLQTRRGPATSAPGDGSRTITIHDSQPVEEPSGDSGGDGSQPTLQLRGGPRSKGKVAWDADVVDNEGCGRKKSKICCIYHKPKRFDESSDESSDDSHSDCEDNHPQPVPRNTANSALREGTSVPTTQTPVEPNAYEAQPKNDNGKAKA